MLVALPATAFFLAAMCSPACSLLTSVDGLTGGAAATEGGPGAQDSGDASLGESSTPLVDGGDGGDAGPWCLTHKADAAYCEDFDTDGLAAWDAVIEGAGGTTKPDPGAATSAPYSMLSDLPGANAGKVEAYIARKALLPATSASFDADFRLEKANTASSQLQIGKLLEIDVNGDGTWELGLAINDKRKLVVFQYNYASNGYAEAFVYPTPVALGAWTRVGLHLRLQNTLDGVFDMDIDGARVATAVPVQPLSAKSPFRLFIGAIYTSTPHTGWTLRTDNVLFDTR